jgi:antitoxin component YwqK of YwqJK toxin-antitoxin module
MKTFLLYTLLYLTPMIGLCQNKKVIYKDGDALSYQIGYIDNSGKKDSCWVAYNESNKIVSKANFKNGVKDGEWAVYYNNGNIYIEMFYSNGVLVSGKRWDENGTLIEER